MRITLNRPKQPELTLKDVLPGQVFYWETTGVVALRTELGAVKLGDVTDYLGKLTLGTPYPVGHVYGVNAGGPVRVVEAELVLK